MESENQVPPSTSDTKNIQNSVNAPNTSHHIKYMLISLVVVAVGMGAVYFWQHQKVNALNSQVINMQAALVKDSKISLDNLNALHALPNVVLDTTNSPADLIAFLGADNTQCYKQQNSGFYKVISQNNDQFAEIQYGCTKNANTAPTGPPAHILAKKVNGKWQLISPTNQWQSFKGQDVPSCTMINTNKVSKLVIPQCYDDSKTSQSNPNVTVLQVTNP